VKQGWSVTIEGRADRPLDPEEVLERLQPHHPSVQGAGANLAATVTVDAPGPLQAIEMAHEVVMAAIKPARLAIEAVEAKTEERQDRELEQSNVPDLVGLADIALMAGTTRQRVFQMTANRGFPESILQLAAGRLWSRPAVARYLEETADRRRPIKTLTSQVGGPTMAAGLRSKLRAAAPRR